MAETFRRFVVLFHAVLLVAFAFAEAPVSFSGCSPDRNADPLCSASQEEFNGQPLQFPDPSHGVAAKRLNSYLKAIRLDPTNSNAWNHLGAVMNVGERVAVSGADRTKRDCFLEGLRLDPTNSIAWNNLGVTMTAGELVAFNGTLVSKSDCLGRGNR